MTEEIRNDYRHVLPLQIRFNDVDKFGHVNNTVYFQFYDTAKTDYIATVCKGVDWERLAIVVVKIVLSLWLRSRATTILQAAPVSSRLATRVFIWSKMLSTAPHMK